ncbi:MAG: transporter [Rhodospirillales bacterium]|jgi:MFS family permease|nr:transporter [Rhodospirillales bacterium]
MAPVFRARALRDFGDGAAAVLLPAHLTALGFGPAEIGLLATLALLGSAAVTLSIGVYGGRFHVRPMLLASAALMAATGIGYATAESFSLIALVALLGTINPTAGSASLFMPLEHAVLAETPPARRTHVFALYSLLGSLAAALGSLASGVPGWLGIGLGSAFLAYAALGAGVAVAYTGLPRAATGEVPDGRLGPSRGVVLRLAAVFSLDSFAGGFAVQALLALFLFRKFDLSVAEAGAFFFISGLLAAVSMPIAAWLGQRIGLVNTMVWTHAPASVCLAIAVYCDDLWLALGFLLVRALLSSMDVPARSSYVMAVVTPAERVAAASFTAVPRSLAAAAGPAIAGWMMAEGWEAAPFVVCAVLKIIYDGLLLTMFAKVREAG